MKTYFVWIKHTKYDKFDEYEIPDELYFEAEIVEESAGKAKSQAKKLWRRDYGCDVDYLQIRATEMKDTVLPITPPRPAEVRTLGFEPRPLSILLL